MDTLADFSRILDELRRALPSAQAEGYLVAAKDGIIFAPKELKLAKHLLGLETATAVDPSDGQDAAPGTGYAGSARSA